MPGRFFDFYFVPLLLFVLLVGNSFARDLHVDPESGDDSNDGVALPVRSISRGIALAGPGDTVHLKPTVYHDYAGFYRKQGEAGRPVILDGHGATLEGSDAIDPEDWEEVEPGLYRSTVLPPHWNEAVLARWFFLFADTMQRMDRVLKGKSAPLKQPYELGAGEWTFVRNEGAAEDDWSGTFYLKIAEGKTLAESEIRWPVRSAGVQFSGDNAHLVIRNLTATHPHNDGFNIHGDCRNVVFENIRAIECGDDGISAHESAEYRVDGFVSIGNGTGICDTGDSTTTYKNVFIADCVGVDLYFLDRGRYEIENAFVLSLAQKPLVVTGRAGGNCSLTLTNIYIKRVGPSEPALAASRSVLNATGVTLENLPLKVTGESNLKDCLIEGKAVPDDTGESGADLPGLLKAVVPDDYRKKL